MLQHSRWGRFRVIMSKKQHEVYLGEIICSSGTNDKNIANKANKGVGAVSQIFSSLNQISLGHYFYEIALTMRDTILVSKMVSSSEIWYHISKQEYQKLESVDEMFLRRLLSVPVFGIWETFNKKSHKN